ncbi:MAG: hypothetical protein AAFV62_06715 [Pseudomonadota bacterium]
MTKPRLKMIAEIDEDKGPRLSPESFDHQSARAIAQEICNALVGAYQSRQDSRPETLCLALASSLETLLDGIEKEGVSVSTMRLALAKMLIECGEGTVELSDPAPRSADAEQDAVLAEAIDRIDPDELMVPSDATIH